ncbi:MAG: response regulator [Chloroflexi bacterium]|nr:response regulator [Chloroflexota bacterium]
MEAIDNTAKKILVVEDEPAISQVCQRVLTSEGIEVDIAVNGKVAQAMIEKKQYDLCLVDIRTPVMDGKELYHWLQDKHPQLAGRVIFTTGDTMGGDTQSFLEQTARPFLPKPFTPDEIRTVIREVLKEVE